MYGANVEESVFDITLKILRQEKWMTTTKVNYFLVGIVVGLLV